MRLGVPFITPRQLGAVESNPGRKFLPSVDWRTGQSGAPPDTIRCGFLSYSGAAGRWRLRAIGAPNTVWCTPDSPVPHIAVSSATCHARIARPTVGAPDRWLTRQSGVSPDSPVNYSRTLLTWFPRAVTSPQPTHRTLSGAPLDSPVIYSRTPPSRPESSLFTRASLAHRTLSGAPPDSPVHPDRAAFWLYIANFSIIVSPVSST
jgi:hypothetical protein